MFVINERFKIVYFNWLIDKGEQISINFILFKYWLKIIFLFAILHSTTFCLHLKQFFQLTDEAKDNAAIKNSIRQKCVGYLDRAEQLKKHLEGQKTGKTKKKKEVKEGS